MCLDYSVQYPMGYPVPVPKPCSDRGTAPSPGGV